MKHIIRILLDDGHHISAMETPEDSRKIIDQWVDAMVTGAHRCLRGQDILSGTPWEWAVFTHRIVAIHTAVLQEEPALGRPIPGPLSWPKISGPH